jgi:hypothetical protein
MFMKPQRDELERVVGGKIAQLSEQQLPGITLSPSSEVLFFQDDGKHGLYEQFDRLTGQVSPSVVTDGGVTTTKHTLTLPDGRLFHAIRYRGDIDGWRKQITLGAHALSVVLGSINDGTTFVTNDGVSFALTDCKHGTV